VSTAQEEKLNGDESAKITFWSDFFFYSLLSSASTPVYFHAFLHANISMLQSEVQ
jgi:hypothetical protein